MPIVRKKIEENIVAPQKIENENLEEITLRPKKLNEYIGQEEIKDNVSISIKACKKRNEPLDHILIYGAAGLGKTTLASIIAYEMGVSLKISSGPALEKSGDLASILTSLKDHDILFIDEIHRLKPQVEETLYSAMEDFAIDIVLGKGPGARTMRLKMPKFTLIGATTKMSMLSSPLRDRFGHIFKLNFYENHEIEKILARSSKILKCNATDEACQLLAKSSRQTPRIANRLLKRCADFAIISENNIIDRAIAETCLKKLNIDRIGLTTSDLDILLTIINKFKGGPVSLHTIASATCEDEDTVEDAFEPYLIKIGFLERTSRGRVVTENAYMHLNINFPKC